MRNRLVNEFSPVLVTKSEAARLLSLPDTTVEQLIATGDLPVKRVGTEQLIPYRSLLIFAGVARWKFQEIVEL